MTRIFLAFVLVLSIPREAALLNSSVSVPPSERDHEEARNSSIKAKINSSPLLQYDAYTYTGKLGYNDTCLSDASKEDILLTLRGRPDHETLLKQLENESCNITKYLECRQVRLEIQSEVLVDIEPVPVSKCSCPDYEKIDAIHTNAYFDHDLDQCVLKVRTKCTGFIIPPSARRYNGTGQNKVADNRTQPFVLPCIKHAICNIFIINSESPDVNANKCICQQGYFPGDDNMCYEIGEDRRSSETLAATFLMLTVFAVFLVVMLCDNGRIWDDERRGSQDELIIPGSHFQKKIFPSHKRRL